MTLPLFPLHTVLFPGGLLPLKVFEQRYVEMTKACMKGDRPFGVCLIVKGEEVAGQGRGTPEIATVGTLARISDWDVPQAGILHLATIGQSLSTTEAQEASAAISTWTQENCSSNP